MTKEQLQIHVALEQLFGELFEQLDGTPLGADLQEQGTELLQQLEALEVVG